jgi:superfamily II DNA or RNA helicase
MPALWDDLPDDEPSFRLEPPGEILPVRLAPGVKARDYGLRWYQGNGKSAVEASLEVNRSCVVVMATGLGKTRLGGAIAGDWPGNVLWLAHRDELIQQARADLERITGEMVEIEQGQTRASSRARIVVGSVDTVKRQNRLDRYGSDRFQLVIADECFPAGTMVDGRPIERILPGEKVWSFDHGTGMMSRRRVVRLFKKAIPSMWRLWYGASHVDCTENHPVFVKGKGYVEAKSLVPGDLLCVRHPVHVRGRDGGSGAEDLLQGVSVLDLLGSYGAHEPDPRLGANENEQPDAPRGQQGTDGGDTLTYRAQAQGSRGERERAYPGARASLEGARGRVDGGAGYPDMSAQGQRISFSLQGGFGSQWNDGRGGSGRRQPCHDRPEGPGQEERGLLAWVGVDRVESLEPSSSHGDFVYNLEVEGSHTYFANDVLVHNCHHYTAATYRRPLDFFAGAKLIGLTATPDRGDEKALGQIFDDVAFVFDIQNGIEQGYLVPLRAHTVEVKSLDISGVATQAGDLVAAQLDEVMLKACAGIVSETLKYEPNRQGIVFMPGVKSAELAAQLFNRSKPGSASFVSGMTDPDERRDIVKAFREGRTQYLCNCQIASEGFDAPGCSMIVQGRPTKSRALAAQMVGRGTRVLPGIVEHLDGEHRAAERQAAIAASAKPDMVVLDFVGNCGRHTLVTPADILGGNYSEAEVTLAKKKTKGGGDVLKALEEARAQLRRIAEKAAIKASSVRTEVDPFGVFHIKRDEGDVRFGRQPMTQGQYEYLDRMGVKPDQLNQMSKAEASRLISTAKVRRDHGLCTFKQMRLLQQNGVTDIQVGFEKATEALDYIFKTRREGGKPDPAQLDAIIHRQREPGEDHV